jgi:hypothetical protein
MHEGRSFLRPFLFCLATRSITPPPPVLPASALRVFAKTPIGWRERPREPLSRGPPENRRWNAGFIRQGVVGQKPLPTEVGVPG